MNETFTAPIKPCLRSGLCCKKGPCAFGHWNVEKHQCDFLFEDQKGDGWTIYGCSKKVEIEKIPGAEFNPAFGAGCCMPLFNENRAAILRHTVTRLL